MSIKIVKRISVAVNTSSDYRAIKMAAVLTVSTLDTMSLRPKLESAVLYHWKTSTWMVSHI